MAISDYTNSLDPNVSSETATPFNNELPSSETMNQIETETTVSNTTAYAGYNPNDDDNAPELGAVDSPVGDAWAPLIVFVVLYVARIIHKERKKMNRLYLNKI
ncbi:hypothetical protein CLV62_11469 [Dysgonomonas alginatilytica]|uniref:Uncharacterized protein n=1 Tax=Dysgonomonas alginatilytica TaxID=1605892 RepID=A0A2V3PNH3_9BACT|nr:hypothetical protein [Dysgonomonas alginatilytica]PXV63352.1 hypothetical protein CLV62_11469 [Dysgonomonas alginatilytica]